MIPAVGWTISSLLLSLKEIRKALSPIDFIYIFLMDFQLKINPERQQILNSIQNLRQSEAVLTHSCMLKIHNKELNIIQYCN